MNKSTSPRSFVIGDIHGAYLALRQCLDSVSFDYSNDILFSLGDVVDGWPETRQCIDELLKIKNLKYVVGNHDYMALQWMEKGNMDPNWLSQGGIATIESYEHKKVSEEHMKLLRDSPFYIKDNDRLFVHGGINPLEPLEEQDEHNFIWDRALFSEAIRRHEMGISEPLTEFKEIFIGHTPIHRYGFTEPAKACEVWLMDTGAGWEGVLSIMDLGSYEIHTSDPVPQLYPDHPGRSG